MVFELVLNHVRLRQAGNNSQIGSSPALIDSPSSLCQFLNKQALHFFFLLSAFIFVCGMSSVAIADTTGSGTAATGLTQWNANCASCHGGVGTVDTQRLNAANAGDVIQSALNNGYMAVAISATNINHIAAWINTQLPAIATQTTAYVTPKSITIPNITLGLTVTSINVVSGPSKGTLGAFSGNTVTYTPSAGQTGADSFTIQAVGNVGGNAASTNVRTVPINITAPAAPTIASSTTASGSGGTAFNYQITATLTPTSFNATGLPAGLSVNTSTGAITGTPTVNGTFTPTISATNPGGTGSTTLTITLTATTPAITSATTASGSGGAAFNYQITASNVPTSFNATGLPTGLSINTSTGAITGTPTVNGTFTPTISATNAAGTGSATLTITLTATTPAITSATTASGSGGTAFNYQITASNVPTSFNATGLPTGLGVNTSTGVISGTPATNGTFTPTISATNAAGTGSTTLTITLNATQPVITSATTASGSGGTAFNYQITASNIPTSFNATGLPTGLSVNTSTGAITGTPSVNGTFTPTISATNASGTGSTTLTITLTASTPAITSSTTASGSGGTAFNYQITASNVPTSFNATPLPSGLSVNTSTGAITGTPTVNGTFTPTISASNASGTDSTTLTITLTATTPVITSAITASGSGGTAFNYQITASNVPTSFNATGLPAGLSINTSTGVISGTPTVNGTVTATISATNAAGTGSATLTITLNATQPVITSATTATVTAGQAFSYQITASNVPNSSNGFNATSLPAGLSVNTTTGLISGIPPINGNFNVTISAINAAGTGSATLALTVIAANTVVSDASLTVVLNTPTTIDLTPYITATTLTGVNVVSAAKHGSTTVNGKTVTYTPTQDYFGTDTFTYQAFGAGGPSAGVATVTVTIAGRPDPTQNTNVTGLMTAQMDAAQRFNRTQLSNFQQRMEFLHRRGSVASTTASGLADSAGVALRPTTTLGTIEAQSASLRAQDNQAALATNPQAASAQPAQALPQQAVIAYQNNPGQVADTDPGVVGLLNGPVGSSLLAALTSNSVNLAALSKGLGVGGSSSDPDAVEIWVAGNLRFGSINNGVNSGYTNFRTDGVTIGADKRFSDKLVLGVGVGYAFDTAKVGTDGSKAESNGMSVAMYGSYQPTPRTFVDGLLGYGVMKFDTERFVSSVSDFARAGRRGDQVFASLASGYEFREKGFMLSPYGRVDVAYSRLREATEAGAGQNALHYDSQDARFAQLALGLRAEATHQTNFGLALPRARLEYQNSYQEGGDTSIQYADQLGTSYRLTGASNNRSAVVAGVGSDFILKNGIRLALDYQTLRSAGYESSQAVSFRLTKELGGANNQSPYVASEELTMPKLGVRVDMGYTFDDNINRTKVASEKEIDRIFSINLTKSNNIQIRQNTRLVLSGFLGAERAYYFNGLDRVTGGGQAEFQYRTSGAFLAPTFGVFGRAATEQFNSELRDGYRYTAGFTFRKPITDRINTFAALSHIQKNAKDVVFDTKEISLRGNVDYLLSTASTLYLTAEYRHGDILSTGAGSLENLDGSKASVSDDVFVRQNYFTYRFGGDTVLATLGYNLALGPTDGLDFSWRRVESTPSSVPDYVAHKKSYVDNQYSIVYLVRF